MTYGHGYFLEYPLLGLGWGVFPTYDLVINLLVNFGILGTIAFLTYIGYLLFKLSVLNRLLQKDYIRAVLNSLIMILLISQLSGFIYHSQYFWVFLGLAACQALYHKPAHA